MGKHAPYSLTKVDEIEKNVDFNSINGNYLNSETNTSITIKHLDAKNYEITLQNDYKAVGLLVATYKMIVDFYTIEFTNGGLFLNGDRIKQVLYTKQ
jgi:hypothetical protein